MEKKANFKKDMSNLEPKVNIHNYNEHVNVVLLGILHLNVKLF